MPAAEGWPSTTASVLGFSLMASASLRPPWWLHFHRPEVAL